MLISILLLVCIFLSSHLMRGCDCVRTTTSILTSRGGLDKKPQQQKESFKDEPDDDEGDAEDNDGDAPFEQSRTERKKVGRRNVQKASGSRKKKQTVLSMGLESATDFANMALKATKGSVKAAVDLCANKHVNLLQIVGKWRIQQEIEVRAGVFVACPATIEFLEDGTVLTTCEGQEYRSDFTFKERSWPRKCTISFQARAFQGPRDQEPVAMYYKGYFKRSILNPNVVLIRGKVYRLSGKLFFKRQEKCGKFKATKRRYK